MPFSVLSRLKDLARPRVQASNPLDNTLLIIEGPSSLWSSETMNYRLDPAQKAAVAKVPEADRLAVGWDLIVLSRDADFKAGTPIRQIIPGGIAYIFKQGPDGSITATRVGPLKVAPTLEGFEQTADLERTRAAVTERWKAFGFAFTGPWESANLMKLHVVLLALTPPELALLKGLVFDRGGEDPKNAGLYDTTWGKPRVIFYDGAYRNDQVCFVGNGQPCSQGTLFHEIGHALAYAHDQADWHRYEAALAAYEDKVRLYNALPTAIAQNAAFPELDAVHKALEAAKAAFVPDSDLSYFASRFANRPPPTKYGETDHAEFHADSYSLFKSEPEGLKAFDPDLFAYFESGDYLKAWKKNPDGTFEVKG